MTGRKRRFGRHYLVLAAAAMMFGAGFQSHALLFGLEYRFRPICFDKGAGWIELDNWQWKRFDENFGFWLERIGYRTDEKGKIHISRWHRWTKDEILWNYTTKAITYLVETYPTEVHTWKDIVNRAKSGSGGTYGIDCKVARAIPIAE